jgi:hypothetical protein
MQYNTERNQLALPEYGRSIHQMVDHAIAIEDKEERNKAAKTIIKLMGQMNPHLRDVPDFTHKLWDHLHIMSNYQIDVDSPYPKPDREAKERKPEPLPYPQEDAKYRYYGRALEKMVQKAIEHPEGELKDLLVSMLLNLMKRFYLVWNRDSVDDELILKHLEVLSDGKLKAPEGFEMTDTQQILKSNRPKNNPRNLKGKKRKKR